jgi:hypothetical protein
MTCVGVPTDSSPAMSHGGGGGVLLATGAAEERLGGDTG